jgi:hypothetical protein
MGAFDRFRKLEKPRPERGGPTPPTDGVAERFGQPEMPSDPVESAPLNCAKCGGDSPARSETCFNCGAALDTPEMREHQEAYRVRHVEAQRKALAMRELRRKEAEEKAKLGLERRREAASQSAAPTPDRASDTFAGNSPLVWLLRAAAKIPDPWVRLGVQAAIVGGVVALVCYAIASPARYGLLLLVGILVGGGYGRGYYGYGYRRRWWW